MRFETAKEAFSEDRYDTPTGIARPIGDRVLLHSRWWLYFKFAGVVIRSSRQASRGEFYDNDWINACYEIFKYIEDCGGRFCMRGLDNMRKGREPLVIVSNHMSTLETVVFPCLIAPFRPVTFVVKSSLAEGPVFGPVMRSRKPVLVGRKNPREDFRTVMSQGKDILDKGKSLVIFPQSTRTLEFNPTRFNSLGIKLAQKSNVDILPMAIKTDFWGDSKIIKGFGPLYRDKTIHIALGEPVTIKGNGKEEHQQIIDFISSHLDQWK